MTPHFHTWLAYVNTLLHTDVPKPNPQAYRILLSSRPDFTPAMNPQQVLAAELFIPGYQRPKVTWSGQGRIDPAGFHQYDAEERFVLTAGPQDLVFRTLVLVADAGPHPALEIDAINIATGVLTTAQPHGLSEGEPVLLTTDGQLPGGLPPGLLFTEITSPNSLRLRKEDLVSFSTPGTGRRLLRRPGGAFRPVFYHTFETHVWIPARASHPYRLATRIRG